MKDLMMRIIKFSNDRDWNQFHSPDNLSKSITIEAAELLENFQWTRHFDIQSVQDELADVMIYCLLLANQLGLDPIDIMNQKIEGNEKKYPVDKAKGTSKKYTEL